MSSQWKDRLPAPKLELLERCWRMRAVASGRVLVCDIYRTEIGLEVRAGFPSELIHSKYARTIEAARSLADHYKLALSHELGGMLEIPLEPQSGEAR